MALWDDLYVEQAPADELVTTFGFFFGLSRWESGRVVDYFERDGDLALRVTYEKRGFRIDDIDRGPGLTDSRLGELRAKIEESILEDHGTVVCRDFLFSGLRVGGWWRHGDQWQLLPAPETVPTLTTEMGLHPFVIEFRVRESSDFTMRNLRRERRIWELHVVLSLLLQPGVSRITPRVRHFWAYNLGDKESRYAQEMYFVPGFTALEADFTDPGALNAMTEVADDDYFGRRGISVGDSPLQVPVCLGEVASRLDAASGDVRAQFLLSAHWRDQSANTWDVSTSLSYISAVNALEVLLPEQQRDPCPTCGLDRSPGPTRKLKQLIDTYAPEVDFGQRAKLYRLRSSLVHGHLVLGLDLPRGFGALVPRIQDEMDTFEAALHASRLVAIRWLRGQTG